jgi:tRNA(Ile2) C34 agmatinyltransferase TiaS
MLHCELCGGQMTSLGWWAGWYWARCRDCGFDQRFTQDEVDEIEEELG